MVENLCLARWADAKMAGTADARARASRRRRASGGGRFGHARVHRLEDRVLAQRLARELRTDPPAVEDEHAVADGGELVEVGRGEQHDRPGGGGAADEDVHLRLRADVDAAGGVV